MLACLPIFTDMDYRNIGEKNIKATILVSYAVVVILIGSILYFTFTSFQHLTNSSDSLAQPNARINLLHDVVFSIYHAESHIRAYSLNQDEASLDAYFEQLIQVNRMVDSLNVLAENDPFFLQTIDSINVQLLNKTLLLEQFIQLKKQDQQSAFYEKAIDRIIEVAENETKLKEVTHQSIISPVPPFLADTPQLPDSLVDDSMADAFESLEYTAHHFSPEELKEEKSNFFTRIRDLLTGYRQEPVPVIQEPREEQVRQVQQIVQQIRTDSIITVYRDTEDLKHQIESTLANLMQSMMRDQQRLQKMENAILLEDKIVMDRIWDYVTILQNYEQSGEVREAENAHATVNLTTEKIFALVVFLLLVLLIFSGLLINDVNKSRFYKKQLIQQKSRAEQLVQVKQRFMANISHEIRTPLNSIIGFSRQLEKVRLKKETRTFVQAINQSSIHLRDIVNDILDFSRIEAGKVELEVAPIDLKQILEEVYNTLSIIAREKNLEFKLDTSDLHHSHLMGDALRIKQVLLNLAANAIKFTHEGYVHIIASDYVKRDHPQKNHVHIRVADTGIGIPAMHQATIFEEFAQGDNLASRKHGGTGLGLSISKKLVEYMNGTIELFSQENVGSTFSVHLPMIITPAGKTLPQARENIVPVRAARILLIDDDQFNRLLFRTLFEARENIAFFEADDAITGFKLLDEQPFDLIITDIQMPGLSGVDMIRQLRNNPDALNRNTPVLACTADVTDETLMSIRDSGMEDYLVKPVDEDELISKINQLLAGEPRQESFPRDPDAGLPDGALPGVHPGKKPYDLEGLMAFTGNDPKSIVPVIEVFIKDTKVNLSLLDKSLQQNNRREIYRVIHKMDNMFGLLRAESALFHLKKLNQRRDQAMSEQEMHENVRNIITISSHVIHALDADLKAISLGSYPEN